MTSAHSITTSMLKSLAIIALLPSLMTGCQIQSPHTASHAYGQHHKATKLLSHSEHSHSHQLTNNTTANKKTNITGQYAVKQDAESNGSHLDTSLIIDIDKVGFGKLDWTATTSKKINVNIRQAKLDSSSSNRHSTAQGQQYQCHYQGIAELMGQDALHGLIYTLPVSSLISNNIDQANGLLFFRFKDGTLSVDSNNSKALTQFCSGAAALKGEYYKF